MVPSASALNVSPTPGLLSVVSAPIASGQYRSASEVASVIAREQTFEILESISDAFYAVDDRWRFTYINGAAEALWGRRREDLIGKAIWEEFPQAVGSKPYQAHQRAMQEQRPVRVGAKSPVLDRWLDVSIYPTDDSGLSVYFRDVTGREHIDMSERLLAAIVQSSGDAIISKDLESIITSWNPGAERLFGYCAEEVLGEPITLLFPEERLDEETRILDSIRRGERIGSYETVRRRKDGSLVEVSLTVSPVRDARGRIVGASKIARDISERKQAERQQQLLIHELKHRVKNILATVQSIARQNFRSGQWDEATRDAFEGRLLALSKAHDLVANGNWDGAKLTEIVSVTLSPYRRERFEIDGPDIGLTARVALALALALHELATNAAKYGALSEPSGRVAILWRIDSGDPPHLIFCWQERGGPPVLLPQRKGFGSRLIERSFAQEPGGAVRIIYDPAGVLCEMRLSLADEPATGGRTLA